MILTRTPLRVSLFGGGTDHPEWFMENGGAVLGMAINKYVYVGVKPMPPGQMVDGVPLKYRVQYSKVDDCQTVDEIKHPAVRAAIKYYNLDEPLEFHIFGDLPGRSGLGGSSSFSVGLLHALCELKKFPRGDLAAEAIAFEREFIKEAVGYQDQVFAARGSWGGLKLIRFAANGMSEEYVEADSNWLKELEDSMLLMYSGTMRDAHIMAEKQIANIGQNEELLRTMYTLTLGVADSIKCHDITVKELGTALDYTWSLKKKLAPEISTPDIDSLYNKALGLGAYGGKLLGAGGGGFMLVLVPPEQKSWFAYRIGTPCVNFKIAFNGSQIVIAEPT